MLVHNTCHCPWEGLKDIKKDIHRHQDVYPIQVSNTENAVQDK
jgi:hypothetical protein